MSNPHHRIDMIRQRLETALAPQQLDIVDDSHLHAGHASAGGAGHFTVNIVADAFAGKAMLQRHRLVYSALEDMMQSDIHALSIKAKTPDEFSQ